MWYYCIYKPLLFYELTIFFFYNTDVFLNFFINILYKSFFSLASPYNMYKLKSSRQHKLRRCGCIICNKNKKYALLNQKHRVILLKIKYGRVVVNGDGRIFLEHTFYVFVFYYLTKTAVYKSSADCKFIFLIKKKVIAPSW